MHTGIISFADRVVHNIKTNDMKDLILEQLYKLYNIKIIQKQYHKLDSANIGHVVRNPHMCNLRSNGNPYMMFFTTYNDIPIIYFVDKKVHPGYQKPRILLVRGLFAQSLFKNTLIDGEMVKCNNGKWLFLFNDIIAYEGKYLNKLMLPDRLKILYKILDKQHTPDKIIDVCEYQVKKYYHVYKESINALIELSKILNYTCRGIYIWSYDLRYKNKLYNFNEDIIVDVVRKVKDETEFQMISDIPRETRESPIEKDEKIDVSKETIEQKDEKILWLAQSDYPDVYNIYENENILVSKTIGTILIPDLTTSKMIRNAFKTQNTSVVSVVATRCMYNTKFNKWYPIDVVQK